MKASTSEEESRYSQRTMTDLRDNLAGTKTAYAVFQPWLLSKTNGGADLDRDILAGFGRLDAAYSQVQGDASVTAQVDRAKPDSEVSKLDTAGTLLGFAVPGK